MKLWFVLAFALGFLSLFALGAVVTISGSNAAHNLQSDLDCNGVVEPYDALTAARFELSIDYDGPCLSVAGDPNCDGLINSLDMLWIMLYLADLPADPPDDCVEVGEPLLADEASVNVVIDLEVTARLQCNAEVPHHILAISWEVTGADPPANVTVKAVYAWGTEDSLQTTDLSGQTEFTEADVGGGAVIVSVTVEASDNQVYEAHENLQLDTCVDLPATPVPGAGFFALATPGPPDLPLAGPPGEIREVDVAHIGGGPNLPVDDVSVVGVGTGAAWRLLSYGTTGSPPVAEALDESAAYAGYDIKLIALKPELSPNLDRNLLVVGYLKDGVLWLSSWRIDEDGSFTGLDKRGFGPNLGIIVERYAIAQRQLGANSFQVVTPIIGMQVTPQGADPDIGVRVVSWSVNETTGAINGIQASNPFGDPHEDTELAITALDGESVTPGSYAVSYRAFNDVMETQYWSVADNGDPFIRGKARAGYSRDGSSNAGDTITQTALLPLTDGGFISPYVNAGGFTMATWETRLDFCLFAACFFAPYRISDETNDMKVGIGVTLPGANQPTLTNGSNANVQNGAIQPVRARLTDGLWEEDFGVGAGTMYQQTPAGPIAVGIASVGKTMTLWLAAEMIRNGEASLDDEVTVSSVAVNAGGSSMGLSVGEKHTLENLLLGMIIPSGNDAAFAIGEYLAGDVPTWVAMMNQRAVDLGLVNTIYSRPSGGAYSTTQEQTTLWMNASKEPLFQQFASATTAAPCGEDINGQPVCYNLQRNPPNYPGWGGYKGGSVGWSIPSYAAQNIPLCTACLVAEDTRLGRRIIVMLQQSGATGGDAVELFDYGFLTLFTPDRVGNVSTGSAKDFGLDAIDDGLAIDAHIDVDDHLQVCTYSMFADGGQLSENGCSSPRLANMLGGGANATRTMVDGVRVSTLLREGDYLTGYWVAGHIVLDLWQVASKEP